MSAQQPHYMILIGSIAAEQTPQIDTTVTSVGARKYFAELASIPGTKTGEEIWFDMKNYCLIIGDKRVVMIEVVMLALIVSHKHNGVLMRMLQYEVLCMEYEHPQMEREYQKEMWRKEGNPSDRSARLAARQLFRQKARALFSDGHMSKCP